MNATPGRTSRYFSISGDRIKVATDSRDRFRDLLDAAEQTDAISALDIGHGDHLFQSTRLAALDQDAFTFF